MMMETAVWDSENAHYRKSIVLVMLRNQPGPGKSYSLLRHGD